MLEFGDTAYYIDIKALENIIILKDNNEEKTKETEWKTTYGINSAGDKVEVSAECYERFIPKHKEIDVTKYDLLKTFIEYIIDYEDDADDTLGSDRAFNETPLGYKIVFNTLLKEGILKEKEE